MVSNREMKKKMQTRADSKFRVLNGEVERKVGTRGLRSRALKRGVESIMGSGPQVLQRKVAEGIIDTSGP